MDAAKLRRDARRRKILENAEGRLQMITQCKTEELPSKYQEIKLVHSINLHKSGNKYLEDSAPSEHLESELNNIDLLNENISSPSAIQKKNNPQSQLFRTLAFKLIILAIAVRMLHIFKFGYLFGETIIIPFALFMLTQLDACQLEDNIFGVAGTLLLLSGVSPSGIRKVVMCYNATTSLLLYFGIYFLSFSCTHIVITKVFES